MTKNWKDIHPEFTEELQRVWEKEFSGFYDSYKRCKEYIDKGLRPEEAEFAKYLWQQGYYSDGSGQWAGEDAEEIAKKVKELRAERILWKNIGNFVSEITKQLQGQGLIPGSDSQQPSEEDYFNEKWKSKGFDADQTKEWIKSGLSPDDYEFADYLRKKGHSNSNQTLNLEQLRIEFNDWQKNPPAQEHLDSFYPKEGREEIKELDLRDKRLTGPLDLNDFVNLESLDYADNQLTHLDLTNCARLRYLDCGENYLQDLKLPLRTEKMTYLDISNNNLPEQDLSVFSRLNNLEVLIIGNDSWRSEIRQGIYNRFYGSLKPLENLTKLRWLNINGTDLNSGVEHLPDNLSGSYKVFYSDDKRPESKIQEIKWRLNLFASGTQKNWETLGFILIDIKLWMEAGLRADDYHLADYLRHRGYTPKQELNLVELRKGYIKELKKQKWFWESELTEVDLLQRWKDTNPKEQINFLKDECEIIEKPNESKNEIEQKEITQSQLDELSELINEGLNSEVRSFSRQTDQILETKIIQPTNLPPKK